jgi:DNA-binding NarL/FixJ family response regulator
VKPITVVLIEDSPILLGLVTVFLERTQAGVIRLVGSARSGEDGLALVRAEQPAVAIVDLRLPGMSGLEVIRRLRADDARRAIVVLSSADPGDFRAGAVAAGADAFVPKDRLNAELMPAIRLAVRTRNTLELQGDQIDA